MSNEEIYPVVVVQGHPCMGCGQTGVVCLELGVKGGHQTLACRKCTNMVYDRAEGVLPEQSDQRVSEEVEIVNDLSDSGTGETIRVEVDPNEPVEM